MEETFHVLLHQQSVTEECFLCPEETTEHSTFYCTNSLVGCWWLSPSVLECVFMCVWRGPTCRGLSPAAAVSCGVGPSQSAARRTRFAGRPAPAGAAPAAAASQSAGTHTPAATSPARWLPGTHTHIGIDTHTQTLTYKYMSKDFNCYILF